VAPITDAQLDLIRTRIQALSRPSISVSAVEVKDIDGVDGPAVLVTVRLTSAGAGAEWDADDFLAIRRQARTVAVEALSGQDVRLVYASAASADESDDEADVEGGKLTLEQDS